MPLTVGSRLGSYEVTAKLGEGGMGEVYRARDTKLDRDVAIKVLSAAFAADAERLARFQREAKTLAALNHPNIGGIHGLEESGGTTALVLEYIDGPTLAEHIARGPIPVSEALPIANDIALAIEAAHEQGIIHRDLKPANIKVRPDGTVKVLDFGLAKALATETAERSVSESPTLSLTGATRMGTVLGTAAYMAPEQAKGKAVDRRADVWAFGAVLYEMLTGKKAFAGEDISDTLVAVLRDDPDWSALPGDVPAYVQQVIRVCLEKDPKRRPRDISAIRLAIDGVFSTPTQVTPTAETATVASGKTRSIAAVAGGALVIGALIASGVTAWVMSRSRPSAPPARVGRFILPSSPSAVVQFVILTPDGSGVVYRSFDGDGGSLFRRSFADAEPTPISGTRGMAPNEGGGVFNFAFSPDGASLVFFQNGNWMRIPVGGGVPQAICPVDGFANGVSWGDDGWIVFSNSRGIWRVREEGGTPEQLTTPGQAGSGAQHVFPSALPGGRGILFVADDGTLASSRVMLRLPSGDVKELVQRGMAPKFVASGHLVYAAAGVLMAVPFDLDRLEVTGTPVPVLEGLPPGGARGASPYSVSNDGSLAYVGGEAAVARTAVWVDRNGREDPTKVPPRLYTYARLSPDGTRIALDARDENADIWIWDIARETLQRLTSDPGLNRSPVWTKDGSRIAFTAIREGQAEGIYWQAADSSGEPERLSVNTTKQQGAATFSADERRLLFHTPLTPPYDVGVLYLDEKREEMLLSTPVSESNPVISPDGNWLAYQSEESGRPEVYLSPFPDVTRSKRVVSSAGGTRPLWSRDGRELFYFLPPDTIMSVSVTPADTPTLGKPAQVIKGPFALALNTGRHYDVSPDGKRFLLLKEVGAGSTGPELRVILNWTGELKRLVPTSK